MCNAGIDHLSQYIDVGSIDSDQEKYSMLDRDLEKEQAPYCRDKNISIFAYSPLANGLLTGKMTPDRKFASGDLRANNSRFSVENRRRINEMLGEFKPIAEAHNASIVQLVTAWTLAQPGITHALLCPIRGYIHLKKAKRPY